jgi:hypothetical protein
MKDKPAYAIEQAGAKKNQTSTLRDTNVVKKQGLVLAVV